MTHGSSDVWQEKGGQEEEPESRVVEKKGHSHTVMCERMEFGQSEKITEYSQLIKGL